jgi:hypothetical protein
MTSLALNFSGSPSSSEAREMVEKPTKKSSIRTIEKGLVLLENTVILGFFQGLKSDRKGINYRSTKKSFKIFLGANLGPRSVIDFMVQKAYFKHGKNEIRY